ncbi:MAG: phosphatase PAP2 family protein [Saprospiraceae bacterium]|nr:phosphatase PAP2 family protein [Saprospiraceae bacterium]
MALKKNISFFFLFLFPFVLIQAQIKNPYVCAKKKDAIIYAIGSASLGLGYYLGIKTPSLKIEEIQLLDKNSINRFDRIATSYSSSWARKGSDVFFYSAMALPSLFVFSKRMRGNANSIAIIYGETLFLTVGITAITKKTVLRSRPFVYNSSFDINDKTGKNARYSFFSGHTSVVSASSFFTAKVFADYCPDSKWKSIVWGAAATLPAITGYLRVRAGKHYPTDVIIGYAVGAAIGILVPQIHKRKKRNENIQLSINPTGGYLGVRF